MAEQLSADDLVVCDAEGLEDLRQRLSGGFQPVFHAHTSTYVEAPAEIDRLLHRRDLLLEGGPLVDHAPRLGQFGIARGHGLVREDMHSGSISHLGIVVLPVLLALSQYRRIGGRFLRRLHLEWLHRLITQPWRWRRQLGSRHVALRPMRRPSCSRRRRSFAVRPRRDARGAA